MRIGVWHEHIQTKGPRDAQRDKKEQASKKKKGTILPGQEIKDESRKYLST
jgi:hypothetical protein